MAFAGFIAIGCKVVTAGRPEAHEPKKLVILPGGHFDAYVKGFEAASVGP